MNQRTNTEWTSYKALEVAEGFGSGENATDEEIIEAWAYIIENEMYLHLQGWYGRTARTFVENNLISKEGCINWDEFELLQG